MPKDRRPRGKGRKNKGTKGPSTKRREDGGTKDRRPERREYERQGVEKRRDRAWLGSTAELRRGEWAGQGMIYSTSEG